MFGDEHKRNSNKLGKCGREKRKMEIFYVPISSLHSLPEAELNEINEQYFSFSLFDFSLYPVVYAPYSCQEKHIRGSAISKRFQNGKRWIKIDVSGGGNKDQGYILVSIEWNRQRDMNKLCGMGFFFFLQLYFWWMDERRIPIVRTIRRSLGHLCVPGTLHRTVFSRRSLLMNGRWHSNWSKIM